MSSLRTHKIPKFFWVAAAFLLLLPAAVLLRRPVAQTLFQKGEESSAAWHNDDALSYYTWAARIHNLDGEAEFARAFTLYQKGDIRKSFEAYSAIAAKTPESKIKARAQNGNGVSLFDMSRPDEAIINHKAALSFARKTGDRKLEAESLIGLSRVLYHAKGRFDESRDLLESALKIGRETNDERIIAGALRNIGVVLWWGKGELERPLNQYYFPALELYRKLGDKKSEATMLSNIGHIRSFQNDAYAFMDLQQQSFQIREEIGDLAGLSESYTALGSAYLAVRNLRKASEYFEKSITISKRTGFRLTWNEAEMHLAGVYVETGQYDEAISILEELYKRETDSPGQAASRLGSIGTCYLLKGDLNKAKKVFEKLGLLTSTGNSDDPQTKFAAHVFLGETYLRNGELKNAAEALAIAEVVKSKNRLLIQGQFTYSITKAEYEIKNGNPDAAVAHLKEAADDELNLFAASETNQISVPIPRDYERLFALLIEKLPPLLGDSKLTDELVFRFLEQRRYRSFKNFVIRLGTRKPNPKSSESEENALGEIKRLSAEAKTKEHMRRLRSAYSKFEDAVVRNNFSDPVSAAILASKPADISAAKQSLNHKTAIVEYLFVGEKIYALTIRKGSFRIHSLYVTKSNLRNKAVLLRSALSIVSENSNGEDWEPIARSLYKGLIEPIEESEALAGVERLAIVRSGTLFDVPFAMLLRKHDGLTRFLIEDYELVFPPSVTFFAHEKEDVEELGFVSFGRNSPGSSGLKPLNKAEEEARTVAEMSGGLYFIGNEATETRLKELAPKTGYLNISAHAAANSDMPLLSKILLGSSEADDGDLTIREILELRLNTDLVTIAACEGAKSFSPDPFMSTDIDRSGLTEAFLHAGARNVLASLAPASDDSTFALVQNFYSRLKSQEKSTALANAQRSLLHGTPKNAFSHPRHWANFVLVGNGN